MHEEDYVVGGVPLINPKHIRAGKIVADPSESVSASKCNELELYRLRSGDVIMGRRGEMGRCAIVGPQHEGFVCGTGSLLLRPDLSVVTPLFVATMLSSDSMRRLLTRRALGATLPNLNRAIVGDVEIPRPPMELQNEFERRVATVEELKARQAIAIRELDSLLASIQDCAFRGELSMKEPTAPALA